jgi:DNA polymerase-3 subunit chi
MAEFSFYLLSSESLDKRDEFACKLIEKAYRSACYCYVLTDDAAQSHKINELLWTFRASSFIPHQLYDGTRPELKNIILIGSSAAPTGWQHTVVNLSTNCPEDFSNITRVLEILENNETTRMPGRRRYSQYQKAGIPITTHHINN